MAGLFLNARTAPGTDVWLPRPLDVESICGPLGRIAARHAPIDAGVSNDLADAAGSVVGVAGYVQHNFTRIAQLQAGAAPVQAPVSSGADPAPPDPHRPADAAPSVSVEPVDDGPWSPAGEPPSAGFHEVFPPPPAAGLG